jgi:hypothetical protein
MSNSKQAQTIRERYGTPEDPEKFWRDNGIKGGQTGGGRPFRDKELARRAQQASVAARKAKKAAKEIAQPLLQWLCYFGIMG